MEKYLVYTNITGSANVPDIQNFLLSSGLLFDFEHDYYLHVLRDHSKYKRVFALINVEKHPHHGNEMLQDIRKRCKILQKKGVQIVLCNFWESHEQTMSQDWAEPFKDFDFIVWHGGLCYFWYQMQMKYRADRFKFDHTHKKFDFLYLNKNMGRAHRNYLYNLMCKNNLLDNSLFSNHALGITLDPEYEIPYVTDYPAYGLDQEIYEKPYNLSTFNLASETSVDDKNKFLTEKIWKPIIAKQIFVVQSFVGCLAELVSMGFQTYHKHIDETYDTIYNIEERTEKLAQVCMKLKNIKHSPLYYETQSVREHNAKNFWDKERLAEATRKHFETLIHL